MFVERSELVDAREEDGDGVLVGAGDAVLGGVGVVVCELLREVLAEGDDLVVPGAVLHREVRRVALAAERDALDLGRKRVRHVPTF